MSGTLDPKAPSMRLWQRLLAGGAHEDEATELMNGYAHELAERIRNVHATGEGDAWNWWDAAEIPGACADLIDPVKTGPVRPGEEPTT